MRQSPFRVVVIKYLSPLAVLTLAVCAASACLGQSVGNSTSLNGTVLDATGAVVFGATVKIHNPVSGLDRSVQTDATGGFSFPNVAFNPYHLTVTAKGFASYVQDVQLRSVVPVTLAITLQAVVDTTTITVHDTAGDLVETDSTYHTDLDKSLLDRLPMPEGGGVAAAVENATPGVSADSNNQMHGLGDHAENTISVDNQVNSDQSSKTFSNQIPSNSIQSMEVIPGAPPAEFGGKTSLVVKVSTRSGQGVTTPTGSFTTSYGAFGTSDAAFDLAYGGQNWGNFIAISGTEGGRVLDAPEFAVMHDKGNEENVFDRIDYQVAAGNTVHLNLGWTRSWFQTPDTFDNLNLGAVDPSGDPVPPTDQRSQIKTFNVAPTWTRLLSPTAVFTFGGFVRRDDYNYYPSGDPFSDLGPLNLQRETIGQARTLTNTGIRTDLAYAHGIHNLKLGVTYEQTFLTENDSLGIVDPSLNAPCVNASGTPVAAPGVTNPSLCPIGLYPNQPTPGPATGASPYPFFNPVLLPFDLTRGGGLYPFNGHTDVKELALYAQDTISAGNWSFSLGLRGDLYNGLSIARQVEPRVGVAYNIKPSSTVLRISYARTLETPFNENLVLSNNGCDFAVIAALVPCVPANLNPGFRNEFHAGLQQAFGRYLVFDGEYIWKYTHNGYDFSVLGNTPITFPIEWHNSKIPGYAASVRVPTVHGFSATTVFSSVAARFFPPQVGGLGATVGGNGLPFRIDHDEKFNQSTNLQYQLLKRGPWFGLNWRYDSGQVAGAAPCYGLGPGNDCPASTTLGGLPAVNMFGNGAPLTADEEYEAGFYCGSQHATPTQALPSTCLVSQFGSSLIKVPAPGTENDDHNPPRIASRNLFDASAGIDNMFHGDKRKWDLRVTVVNLMNKVALYNFLSTFSGTHYVTPRAITAQLAFHF
jgi:Carboxypeptidase regulatory-like domain